MKPPKRLRKPKGIAGKSPNKKKKTQGTLPELAGVTDKETVPFQVDIGSISVASGSDQPNLAPVDQTPGQHMAYVMAENDQHQVPRQPTTGMFNNTGLSDCNRGYAQGLYLEIVHESVTPMYTSSVFDSVGAHIPVKIKEKIWAGEYIDLNILLKSAKDLATDSQLNGDLSVKGGLLTITPQRQSTITNLHGASISCSLFEKFSTALHWVTELTSGNSNILHYLDDFLFGGEANSPTCQETLETFKKICSDWGVPLAEDKTVQPTEILTFLGIEFDTLKMEMRLPGEKLTNLKQTLQLFLHSKKVTLRQLQSLIAFQTPLPRSRSVQDSNSRPSLDVLEIELNHLLTSSMAQKTWKTYNTAVESFKIFRSAYNLHDIWPAPLSDLIFYIAFLSFKGLSASTVLTYMSGISYQHKIQDLTDSTKSFLVGKTLEVVKFDHKEELRLCIRSSKTDQLHSSLTLIISEQIDKSLCPIHLLKQFLQIRYPSSGSNLYIHFDGSSLTRYQFSSILQKSLSFSEINGHFRAHSFRIGGATEAKRLGVDDETLKKWGRWTSDAYTKYIRLNI
ncbi:Hypothetical predicted protein [Mytilus galloprovincialis]|uniref:Reverse transcriptase domain-containing protein n=1 Tax=Mytilus galloprovincialis TaxID=29158 RepID=A0A8B6GZY0_MYTGA|nr:Hypothetical predicted protein [Mytilus galloprovincialis]